MREIEQAREFVRDKNDFSDDFIELAEPLLADFAAKIRDEAVAAETSRIVEMIKDVREIYVKHSFYHTGEIECCDDILEALEYRPVSPVIGEMGIHTDG